MCEGRMVERESPTLVRGITTARFFARFLFDPLEAIQQSYRRFGEFVVFEPPIVPTKYSLTCVMAVGSRFNQQVFHDPLTWRTFGVGPGGDKKSASRRLARGIINAQGNEHKHYRQLLLPPLHPKSVDAYKVQLQRLVVHEVESWPLNQAIDLWAYVQNLIQTVAIGLLFGGDQAHGGTVAKLVHRWFDNVWSLKVILCPVNFPGTQYSRMLRDGEALERGILDWAACKQGGLIDKHDLLAILINNPDESGQPASDVKIVGHMPTLLVGAFETCQNALIWTLILLAQHPRIARDLLDEIKGRLAGAAPNLDAISDLPLLTAVIKESMRLFQPVPQQFRVAQKATTLANFPLPEKTRVLLSPLLTNRNPDLYPEPDRFTPERWAAIGPSPYEYLVFSAGPRSCPGYWLGFAMLKVAIAAILTRCHVALAHGARINYKVNLTLTPRGKIPATLHRQDNAFAVSPIQGSIRKLVRLHD